MKGPLGRALLAASLVLFGLAGFSTPSANAATCVAASGAALCNGTVSPGGGTISTTFTFTVFYADSKHRSSCDVQVVIAGVGTFSMTPACSSVSAATLVSGTTFTYTTQLPAGQYTYQFQSTANNPPGPAVQLTFATPTPSPIIVLAPTPTPRPTPVPTPTPTPKPTPAPTPAATPAPTPKPTPRPTAKPALALSSTARPTGTGTTPGSTPAASPADVAVGIGGVGPAGAGGGGSGDLASGGLPGGPGTPWLPLGLIALATGLGGFFLLWRRGRRDEPTLAPVAAAALDSVSGLPSGLGPPAGLDPFVAGARPDVLPSEATIPRWRRQSLREARASVVLPPKEPAERLRFEAPPDPGIERLAVRYDFVALNDRPDVFAAMSITELRSGDEVDVISRHDEWVEAKTPGGAVGWVPATFLEPIGRRRRGPAATGDLGEGDGADTFADPLVVLLRPGATAVGPGPSPGVTSTSQPSSSRASSTSDARPARTTSRGPSRA